MDPKVIERIVVQWDQGKSTTEIGAAYGLTRGQVSGVLNRARARGDKRAARRSDKELTSKVRAKRFGRDGDWTPAEDAILKEHAGKLTTRQLLVKLPGRSIGGIENRARKRLGLSLVVQAAGNSFNPFGKISIPERVAARAAIAKTLQPAPARLEGVEPVSFMDLKDRHCRFPLWADRVPDNVSDIPYCGAPRSSETCSYCETHRLRITAAGAYGVLSDSQIERVASKAA